MYEKPKSLIPKDSMVVLLTDMYIASSAKNQKNKFLKREKNYIILVYERYKIDSTRFDISNEYYTSKIEEYTDMLKKVKSNIDSLSEVYREKRLIKNSIKDSIKKSKGKNIFIDEKSPEELLKGKKKSSLKLMNINEKIVKDKRIELKEVK